MIQSVEQTVQETRQALASARRRYNTPQKARNYLLELGVLERHKDSPHGVRLAKRYRSK